MAHSARAWPRLWFGVTRVAHNPWHLGRTTTEEVIVIEGRRRTYEPVAIQERHGRSSWRNGQKIKGRRLWVGSLWRKHLP